VREALVLVLAYLVGSIPFSFLVARAFGVRDVRESGSGNVGATNVLRAAGRTAGLLAFLADAGKGAAAAALARAWVGGDKVPAAAAALAVLGHVHPVWLSFRGGKGVATGVGAFAPLAPLPAALAIVLFALTLALTRYVSVASLLGTLGLVGSAAFLAPPPVAVASGLAGALIFYRHRENLSRLRAGTERRVGGRS
jgi:glycerol-3-phosphate acyltransferase PlsY